MSAYHPPVAGPFSSYPPVVPSAGPCYVLGCHEPTDNVRAVHRDFGAVLTCLDHHPARGDRGTRPAPPPSGDGAIVDMLNTMDDADIEGGLEVTVPRPKPPQPPSDGAAVNTPRLPVGVRAF